MIKNGKVRTKSGAASFYIVSISTLILTIIAMSFIAIIVSEVERTLNNDLSNSAYDSALAGVEDAKVAYLDYQSCLNQGETAKAPTGSGAVTCGEIIWYMEHPDCDMVGHILQRIGKNEKGEVLIQETKSAANNNGMAQAYTCTTIENKLDDYRATLTSGSSSQLIPLSFDNTEASSIGSIRVSWYSDTDGTTYNFGNKSAFTPAVTDRLATPPTISVQLIQTAATFYIDQFSKSISGTTDRGTLYLVASDDRASSHSYHDGFYDISSDNVIKNSDFQSFVKANDKTDKNVPILVYCPKNSGMEFACSASIQLPSPVGGSRNSDTFMLLVSLPYGGPDTEISIEACTNNADGFCTSTTYSAGAEHEKAQFKGAQISIDSTGRANNLYRRVMTRLETTDIYYSYPFYAIQLIGDGGNVLVKDLTVTSEQNFK